MDVRVGRPFAAGILGMVLLLGGCSHGMQSGPVTNDNPDVNVLPVNYRPDILAAMHAYLNDPTGVREAGISEPALKVIGGNVRYIVCLRFNARKARNEYAGVKEVAAVFVAGRFDRFAEKPRDQTTFEACADATYAPFPELQKLSR